MNILYRGADIYTEGGICTGDLSVVGGKVALSRQDVLYDRTVSAEGLLIVPGFADVHVHFREPGFSYKETIRTGAMAAAHGGYSAVCAMPNLKPAPSSLKNLQEELALIRRDACVRVYPYGTITSDQSGRGVLSAMDELAPYVVGFSDDGKGVQEETLMRAAMQKAKELDRPIVAHCEDERELVKGGCIHDGRYAAEHGLCGISSASEWKQVERDLRLAEETGCRYHVCHVSTKESVDLIRDAKKRGVRVTCETGPHYLIYTDQDLCDSGSWKMNPPIRSAEDREALREGVLDGTIDCLITDHAPHAAEEKARGLAGSAFGIVGLETAFAAVYTYLVKPGILPLSRVIECLCVNPRRIFRLPGAVVRVPGGEAEDGGTKTGETQGDEACIANPGGILGPEAVYADGIVDGAEADLCVWDLQASYRVDAQKDFYSMGKSTMFDGCELSGRIAETLVGGNVVYPFS